MNSVAVYIDGFNLYHGIVDAGWKRWAWVDLARLGRVLIPKTAELHSVNYFTANTRDPDSRPHQGAFLEANIEMGRGTLRIEKGKFVHEDCCWCDECRRRLMRWQEKRTDVALAMSMVTMALDDQRTHDAVYLITGDSDQVPVVSLLMRLGIEVRVRLPPKRPSADLTKTVGGTDLCYEITENQLRKSQLPDQVACTHNNNFVVSRPAGWGERPAGWADL